MTQLMSMRAKPICMSLAIAYDMCTRVTQALKQGPFLEAGESLRKTQGLGEAYSQPELGPHDIKELRMWGLSAWNQSLLSKLLPGSH